MLITKPENLYLMHIKNCLTRKTFKQIQYNKTPIDQAHITHIDYVYI